MENTFSMNSDSTTSTTSTTSATTNTVHTLTDNISTATATATATAITASTDSTSTQVDMSTVTASVATSSSSSSSDEVDMNQLNINSDFYDVRVATIGNVDAGKSTLVGVLTSGQLDNGRGSARAKVFRLNHEAQTGRTSSVSQHLLGFDAAHQAVHLPSISSNTAAAKNKQWGHVVENSKSTISFIDLCGHEKYLKTTIQGLCGHYCDYSCLIVGANMGVSRMTKEHVGISLALEIPFFVVVTKIDMAPADVMRETVKDIYRILKSPQANKMPLIVREEADLDKADFSSASASRICPIFLVSSVKGTNIDLLLKFLGRLKPRWSNPEFLANNLPPDVADNEFDIDEIFNVPGVGVVTSGTVRSGVMAVNQKLFLGPFADNTFRQVLIRSIHTKRISVDSCKQGDSCSIAVRPYKRKDQFAREDVRRGMVLLDSIDKLKPTRTFTAEVVILTHHTSIKKNYSPVIHAGNIRQTAIVMDIDREVLRTGDKAVVKFAFISRCEYLHINSPFLFREGNTKGIGKVIHIEGDQ